MARKTRTFHPDVYEEAIRRYGEGVTERGLSRVEEQQVTRAERQRAGSTDYTFTRDRERDAQAAIAAGDDPPTGYYPPQFPDSTRVRAFRFVPHDPNDTTDAGIGTLYMRFIKYDTPWVYRNVPHGVYAALATDGVSKGRFVNSTLNAFEYSHAAASDMLYFDGF